MFRHIAIPLAAFAFLAAAPAHAEKQFKVAFDYPPGASAEEVYAGFTATARRACEADLRRSGRTTLKHAMAYRAQCKAELLTKAVAAVGDTHLAAIHESETAKIDSRLLAQAN